MATFTAGLNIAMKIPKADYDETVAFYRDTLGLPVTEEDSGTSSIARSHAVQFGPVTLWLDRADHAARSDLWLQVCTDDLQAAMAHLARSGVDPCDEVEQLPGDRAHWVRNPAGVVHLVHQDT
jgi:catechol 2,3-dioxygenase-like lactoylglutathione lyase family enzyme